MAGLYIHIPFCKSRCIYCGFYSTVLLKEREQYIDALCREMEARPAITALGGNYPIRTIYLGGGTPSMLTREQLIKLFQGIEKNYAHFFPASSNCKNPYEGMEITMECNPDDVDEDFCETLRLLPINRISMGVQTFDDHRLEFLHRRHKAKDVKNAIRQLRAIGIQNISIDLMFGFPHETLADWEKDLTEAICLGVEHLSAYSLMYEEGTALYKMLEAGKVAEIDEETSRKMYDTLIDQLTAAGYEHYEISNFAKPGYRSRHNSSYWHEEPYIGLGAAAHSYHRGKEVKRSWNIEKISEYTQYYNQPKTSQISSICGSETLDAVEQYNDLITTALRTKDGIDMAHVRKEFGPEKADQMLQEAKIHINRGLMQIQDEHLSLTRAGLYISDDVMSDFILV